MERSLLVKERDWRHAYKDMSEGQRQQILLAESTASGFALFNLNRTAQYARRVSGIYHQLGRFHGSRHVAGLPEDEDSAPAAMPGTEYLHRSLIYLDWACAEGEEHQSDDPDVYTDLGLMHLETSYLEKDEARQRNTRAKARNHFRRALELNRAQPAASLALAWIERRDDGLSQAIKTLEATVRIVDHSDPDNFRFLRRTYLNRACYRCLILNPTEATRESLGKVLQELQKARGFVAATEWDPCARKNSLNFRNFQPIGLVSRICH